MTNSDQISFEAAISALTQPFNGQYPRPWMTDLVDPSTARVFIVGRNQAKPYDATRLPHRRHIDALFNRNGELCRSLYMELVGESSKTRQNIDQFRGLLLQAGVHQLLETNVICYSTAMSADLTMPTHAGGRAKGTEIFSTLLAYIQPQVLIVHGVGTIRDLSRVLGHDLPVPNAELGQPLSVKINNFTILPVRSLAPTEWWQWHVWAWEYLEMVAQEVAGIVNTEELKKNCV